ncbi:MAG: sirohydrochlorin cobaltochelatase [Firmicutes bacterium]|nr:sirohydrochlorin cobaltochelatase [Bacillota bacterium]
MKKKAILSVSFGTKDAELEKRTLDVLEREYKAVVPKADVYRAITNEALIKIKHELEGDDAPVYAVRESLARMVLDGVTHVYVQPAYLLHGREYEELVNMIFSHKADFVSVKCGEPLLASQEDLEAVSNAIMSDYKLSDDEAVCFVGHGSEHYTNAIYCALDYALKDQGYDNAHIATFNAYPKIDKVIDHLLKKKTKKAFVSPFMFVAGESALEGVSGDGADSIATKLREAGFTVEAKRVCLAENEKIRDIFKKHLAVIAE